MAGDDGGSGNRAEAARSAALRRDARILRRVLLKAVGTSPDSFMRTKKEVKAQSHAYWVNEIKSSTWAVAQRGRKIVGVAAGKSPDSDEDKEDQAFTRYIESVWIKPKFRHKGLGQRLIRYLLEMDIEKIGRSGGFCFGYLPLTIMRQRCTSTWVSCHKNSSFYEGAGIQVT